MIIFWSTSTSEIQLILLNKSSCQDTWWLSKYILAHMICSLKPLSNWAVLRPLHFPQTRDWSTISYLPPSKLKKGKDHHKTKDVVISLHHFRKQHITHEQQLKRLTQRVFDFCYVQAQPRSAKYFRTMDIRYSNSGKEMEGKMW
jgi:hypothetical protein